MHLEPAKVEGSGSSSSTWDDSGVLSTLVSGVEENSLITSPELSLLLYSLSEHLKFCMGEYAVMDRLLD